jgi:RNAse (barnase) inhibitor barstar
MNVFIFDDSGEVNAVHCAKVPSGIKSKPDLLDALSTALCFPDYFGRNWDALEECICDLSWLPDGNIVLTHRDLPLPEDRTSLATYLSLLEDAIKMWNRTENRKLVVRFPPDAQSIIQSILTGV